MKRKIDKIISSNPDGDILWNFALDAQEKAVTYKEKEKTYKYFKRALKYAKASRENYLLEASRNPEQNTLYTENAKLAEQELINPFKKRVKMLKKALFKTELEETNIEIQEVTPNTTIQSLIDPILEVTAYSGFKNTFFAQLQQNSISNLFSLNSFENLAEIDFIPGSDLDKISMLVNRLSSVIESKIHKIASSNNEDKLIIASELMHISHDCTEKLVDWMRPYSAESDYYEFLKQILDTAKKATTAAKTVYSSLHAIKAKICKGQLAYIDQEIEKIQSQSSNTPCL